MTNPIERLGPAPFRHPCMGDEPGINLASTIVLHPQSTDDLLGFCYWTSQVIGQGMHFLAGTYAREGVKPQDNWTFWGPVRSPSGSDGESIFKAQVRQDSLCYSICFHGDEELYQALADCVLCAGLDIPPNYRIVVGRPQSTQENGLAVVKFQVVVPATIHTLSLITRAQVD